MDAIRALEAERDSYRKRLHERIDYAVREFDALVERCAQVAASIKAPKSIGRDHGKHHEAGAQQAAKAIRALKPPVEEREMNVQCDIDTLMVERGARQRRGIAPMTDIPALIARLNSAIRAYEATDNGNSQACELLRDCADVIKAAHLTVSPLPAPGEAAAEAVCHDEQLEIWAGEFVDHLLAIGFAPDFETYGEKIKYFSSVKNAIKDLVEKAFTHPELEKAPVSPLPEEIAELLDLHMGLPALPLVVEPTVMDGHYWVGDTGGRTIARVEDEGVGRAIIAIPRMLAALGRMARENERLHEERETACHAAVNFSNETLRIQAERDAIKAKTIGECLMAAGNWRSRGYANAEAAIRALNPPPPATTETPS